MKFKDPPRPDVDSEVEQRDDVHVAANRCPFCHEDVPAEASVVCQECLARHHDACWQESEACSACRGKTKLGPARSVDLSTVWSTGVGALLLGLVVALRVARDAEVGLVFPAAFGLALASFLFTLGLYLRGRRK